MREIKFRAWDELNNKMKYLGLLGLHYEYSDKLTVYGVEDKDGKVSHTAPVMQFTGLKDKNGKEIYEGDVVLGDICKKRGAASDWIYQVEWGQGAFYGVYYKYRNSDSNKSWVKVREPVVFLTGMEIIGNIYENPELLENNK